MINAINNAVRTQLAAGTALTTELGGTAIYAVQAPEAATLPYVLITIAGGGDLNRTPTREIDVMVQVKAVATTALKAATCADLINSRLHDTTFSMNTPWVVYRCEHDEAFMYVENAERKQYWHAGATYRLRASH